MTPHEREVMQQALNALQREADGWEEPPQKTVAALEALRACLAQPEQKNDGYCQDCEGDYCTAKSGCVALSNPPSKREWQGLTVGEVLAIGKELGVKCKLGGNSEIDFDYARAIETKLREKNQ